MGAHRRIYKQDTHPGKLFSSTESLLREKQTRRESINLLINRLVRSFLDIVVQGSEVHGSIDDCEIVGRNGLVDGISEEGVFIPTPKNLANVFEAVAKCIDGLRRLPNSVKRHDIRDFKEKLQYEASYTL